MEKYNGYNQRSVNLTKRQAELEIAMNQPAGVRIKEEQKPRFRQRLLADLQEAMKGVVQFSHAARRPPSEIGAREVESWAGSPRAT